MPLHLYCILYRYHAHSLNTIEQITKIKITEYTQTFDIPFDSAQNAESVFKTETRLLVIDKMTKICGLRHAINHAPHHTITRVCPATFPPSLSHSVSYHLSHSTVPEHVKYSVLGV